MHLAPGLDVNGQLVVEAEHFLRGVIGTNLAQGRTLRAAAHIYGMRDQYPYQGQTITWQQAQAIARWTSQTLTAADQMLHAHQAGEAFEGNIPLHLGMGPGVYLTAQYTINFADGRQMPPLYYMWHGNHIPSAEEIQTALEENAEDYAFTYGVGSVASISAITYTRLYRG